MTVAIVFLLITVGSVVFHFWSPWWWPEVASNWGGMDDTIILTFWITGFVFGNSSGQAEFAGPIGIAQMTGEVSKIGMVPLVAFVASLSLSLAVINVLPVPGLDGGRLFFILLEFVRGGRRVSPNQEAFVHLLGIVLLISLFLIVSYHDILRLIDGKSFLR